MVEFALRVGGGRSVVICEGRELEVPERMRRSPISSVHRLLDQLAADASSAEEFFAKIESVGWANE